MVSLTVRQELRPNRRAGEAPAEPDLRPSRSKNTASPLTMTRLTTIHSNVMRPGQKPLDRTGLRSYRRHPAIAELFSFFTKSQPRPIKLFSFSPVLPQRHPKPLSTNILHTKTEAFESSSIKPNQGKSSNYLFPFRSSTPWRPAPNPAPFTREIRNVLQNIPKPLGLSRLLALQP
jgi:hypothetical protein